MLFHAFDEADFYFEQSTYHLEGTRIPEFQRAWELVVARHAVLRSSFVLRRDQQPLQLVWKSATLKWEQQDWRTKNQQKQQDELGQWLLADRQHGFDLSKAPLLRLALLRFGESEYEFVLSFHHVLLDGWSLALVLKEVVDTYGEPSVAREEHSL